METKHKITAQTKYYKLLLLMMYAVMITAFWSCQNKEDKQPKNEASEVIEDTAVTKSVVVDQNIIDNNQSEQTPLPQPKTEKVKAEKTEINDLKSRKESDSKSEKADNKKTNVSKETAVTKTAPSQINAEFPGGIDQFNTFFMKEYKKPENVNYWKLNFTLAFAVEKNGSISFLECSPAVEEPLEKEIIRVLSLCPKWQPGELNGKKTRMQYSTPIFLRNTQ